MNVTLTWLAADLRTAGLTVREIDGWQTRARPGPFSPLGVLIHDTGVPTRSGDAPSLQTCIDGRADLPGPLCQLLIARSAAVYVIAGGRCNHAGEGAMPPTIPTNAGNSLLVGIELENTGNGTEPWPAAQVRAAQIATAVILRKAGPGAPTARVWGHKEYAPRRKPDPVGIDMTAFRGAVATLLNPPPSEEDDMPGIHQLGAAMATLDQLYLGHRGTALGLEERASWRKDFEAKLARGEDLAPTYDWIIWALDQEKAKAGR